MKLWAVRDLSRRAEIDSAKMGRERNVILKEGRSIYLSGKIDFDTQLANIVAVASG